MKRVIKRNGAEVEFDPTKIVLAISKANDECDNAITNLAVTVITAKVVDKLEELNRAVSVEEIQDIVEDELMEANSEVAKHYIRYRYEHKLLRESPLDKKIMSIVDYENEEVKQENANKNPEIIPTQRDYIAGEISKDITMRKLLPKNIVYAHNEGIIHFHDSDYFVEHEHNCFTGGTKFITNKGIRQFRDFSDGDKVYVKDMNGDLRLATVRKYEKQSMNRVVLKNGRMTHKVFCTKDHRWILENGEVTTNLSVGDCLWKTKDSTNPDYCGDFSSEMFCLGFIIGDGFDHDRGDSCVGSTYVRLCGDKVKYVDKFLENGFRINSLKDNNNDIMLRRRESVKQDFLNGKAWRFLNPLQQTMLFYGYYAADGAKKSNRISTSDTRIMEMIEYISGIAGFYITSKKEEYRDTPYKKNAFLCTYHFIKKNNEHQKWRVVSITPYRGGELVDAYCVEEPITNSFTLEKGIVTGNCCLVNLEDMLQNGTVISETYIDKPHTFSTACTIATQIIAQVASSQYGGQSISLAHLAPFVEETRKKVIKQHKHLKDILNYDNFTKHVKAEVLEDIKRGVQTLQYQIITLMTTNGQAPFITLYMDINEAKNEKEQADLALCIEEVLKQRIQGVKNEKGVYITTAFPKLIYALDENNVSEGSEFYYLTELAAKCTAKRMVPDYISNKVQKEIKEGATYPCMGCRSFLSVDRTKENYSKCLNWKPGKKYYGRFNQGVVTINLVDVALSSDGNYDEFWDILDDRLENLCYPALMTRHERLKGTPSDVAPILWRYGALARLEKGETIDELLYHGYSTISLGYAGLYECVKYMTGESHTHGGKGFALRVMEVLNEHCNRWKEETNIDFSIYGTPIESTTYKFAKCLQKRFGIIEGITDRNYITNSYHVPVFEEIDAFTKLGFESEFQALSPGGAISYVEVPNMTNNIDAVLAVIQYIYDNIMYAELNTKSDYCQCCGYEGEIMIVQDGDKLVWECPNCRNRDRNKMNIARRTCGYIGVNDFNQGRTQEIKERVLHL